MTMMNGHFERKLVVLYGSQTGTAQAVAERIGREAKRMHFKTSVKSMDDYFDEAKSDIAQEPLVVFVCATTGQGDQPDNMAKFWRFLLKRTLPKDLLQKVNFGVLGLGDSGYAQFNFASKRLHRRLGQLGGTAIVPNGQADDQHDLGQEFVIEPWIKSLWSKVLEMFPLPPGLVPIEDDDPKFKIDFDLLNDNETERIDKDPHCMARISENIRVTAQDHFQDTRLITLDISDQELNYSPGDVCQVQPRNSKSNIDKFLDLFKHFDPDQKFRLVPVDDNAALPPLSILSDPNGVTTLRECAEDLFDLQAIPGRYFFEILAKFTDSELEKEKFREFTSTPEGQQEMFEYCNRPRRTSIEVLDDFSIHAVPWIPMEFLFELFPMIKPRSFSIASSLKSHPGKVQLLVAVVKYRSKLTQPRLGLCSNFLANSNPGDKVKIWIKRGTLKFPPADKSLPLIMVGPGTGVAPFRSAILDEPRYGSVLVFGCRSKDKDYYFEQEWSKLEQQGKLKVLTAFSRDQEDKYYVQDVIKANKELIGDMVVNRSAFFYIAGSSKNMPDQVKEALKEAIKTHLDPYDNPDEYISEMTKDKRLQMETWS